MVGRTHGLSRFETNDYNKALSFSEVLLDFTRFIFSSSVHCYDCSLSLDAGGEMGKTISSLVERLEV